MTKQRIDATTKPIVEQDMAKDHSIRNSNQSIAVKSNVDKYYVQNNRISIINLNQPNHDLRDQVLQSNEMFRGAAPNVQKLQKSIELPYCDGMSDYLMDKVKKCDRINQDDRESQNKKSLWEIYMFDNATGSIRSDYWDVNFEEPKSTEAGRIEMDNSATSMVDLISNERI